MAIEEEATSRPALPAVRLRPSRHADCCLKRGTVPSALPLVLPQHSRAGDTRELAARLPGTDMEVPVREMIHQASRVWSLACGFDGGRSTWWFPPRSAARIPVRVPKA